MLCSFRLALEGKIGEETPESSGLELSEQFLSSQCKFGSFKNPCLKFTLDSEDLFCWYNQKSNFYEVW